MSSKMSSRAESRSRGGVDAWRGFRPNLVRQSISVRGLEGADPRFGYPAAASNSLN